MAQIIRIPDLGIVEIDGMSIEIHSSFRINSVIQNDEQSRISIAMESTSHNPVKSMVFAFGGVSKFSIMLNSLPNQIHISPKISLLGITSNDWDENFYGIYDSAEAISASSLAFIIENNSYIRLTFQSIEVTINAAET